MAYVHTAVWYMHIQRYGICTYSGMAYVHTAVWHMYIQRYGICTYSGTDFGVKITSCLVYVLDKTKWIKGCEAYVDDVTVLL